MNGYFQFMFVDCWPSITWSVVDYFLKPKKGYYALQTVSQPLLPVLRLSVTQFNRGDVLGWGPFLGPLTLVNDSPRPLKGLRVEGRVVDPRGKALLREKHSCNVPADSVVKPFEVQKRFNHIRGFTVPPQARFGEYEIQLRVRDAQGKLIAHNEHGFKVVPKISRP